MDPRFMETAIWGSRLQEIFLVLRTGPLEASWLASPVMLTTVLTKAKQIEAKIATGL